MGVAFHCKPSHDACFGCVVRTAYLGELMGARRARALHEGTKLGSRVPVYSITLVTVQKEIAKILRPRFKCACPRIPERGPPS